MGLFPLTQSRAAPAAPALVGQAEEEPSDGALRRRGGDGIEGRLSAVAAAAAAWGIPAVLVAWSFHAMFVFTWDSAAVAAAPGGPAGACGGGPAGAGGGWAACVWQHLEHGLDCALALSDQEIDTLVRLSLAWIGPAFAARLAFAAVGDIARAAGLAGTAVGTAPDHGPEARTSGAGALRGGVGRQSRGRGPVLSALWIIWNAAGWVWRVTNASLVAVAAMAYVAASMVPLTELSPAVRQTLLPAAVYPLHDWARNWHMMSGYGLFRRMTGVGQKQAKLANGGGAQLPVVARPELEIQASDDGQTWQALEFRYKPGNVSEAPAWVGLPGFPGSFSGLHQPRLDWQMWFAALASYHSNPWLIALVIKILDGSRSAMDLMAPEKWPARWQDPSTPPRLVRIMKFEYDFTRLGPIGEKVPTRWWTRRRVGEYLPALDRNNPSLHDFIRNQGLGVNELAATADNRPAEGLIRTAQDVWRWARGRPVDVIAGLSSLILAAHAVGLARRATRRRAPKVHPTAAATKVKSD